MTEKMYELVCKERFDAIEQKQDAILAAFKGNDGTPGLCEQVRTIQKTYKAIVGVSVFIISIFSIQMIVWLVEELKAVVSK